MIKISVSIVFYLNILIEQKKQYSSVFTSFVLNVNTHAVSPI